jgi:hypothetical protein
LDLWEKVIPAQNLQVVWYEDLVESTEATTRRVLSFLGLSYNESVNHPHLYGGVVTSPSSVNLRLPIEHQKFHSNNKKWEKYASTFEEFMYAYNDARKWIKYVMDGSGVEEGKDASPQGWLERGAHFDELLNTATSSSDDSTTAENGEGRQDHETGSDEL